MKDESGKVLYDLIGISNHFGSTGGGHYTAYCKYDQIYLGIRPAVTGTISMTAALVNSEVRMMSYQIVHIFCSIAVGDSVPCIIQLILLFNFTHFLVFNLFKLVERPIIFLLYTAYN